MPPQILSILDLLKAQLTSPAAYYPLSPAAHIHLSLNAGRRLDVSPDLPPSSTLISDLTPKSSGKQQQQVPCRHELDGEAGVGWGEPALAEKMDEDWRPRSYWRPRRYLAAASSSTLPPASMATSSTPSGRATT